MLHDREDQGFHVISWNYFATNHERGLRWVIYWLNNEPQFRHELSKVESQFSTLAQVMACWLKAPSHHLNQCYSSSVGSSEGNSIGNCLWSNNYNESKATPPKGHHNDVIKWKHFPRNWPCVRGIHRSPVNSPHKGQWRRALMFCVICVWINDWINNREAGDLRRYRAHSDVIEMGGNSGVGNPFSA